MDNQEEEDNIEEQKEEEEKEEKEKGETKENSVDGAETEEDPVFPVAVKESDNESESLIHPIVVAGKKGHKDHVPCQHVKRKKPKSAAQSVAISTGSICFGEASQLIKDVCPLVT